MSQIVIKDLDTTASLNSVAMSATRGGAPREESGKYMSSVNDYKEVFTTDNRGEYPDWYLIEGADADVGTMSAHTANMGIIRGSN